MQATSGGGAVVVGASGSLGHRELPGEDLGSYQTIQNPTDIDKTQAANVQ